jgi:hypothetical protein
VTQNSNITSKWNFETSDATGILYHVRYQKLFERSVDMLNPLKCRRFTAAILTGILFLFFGTCGPGDPVSKAESMIKSKQYSEAIVLLQTLVENDETNARYLKLLGDAHFERARRGRSIYKIYDLSQSDFEDFKAAVMLYEKSQALEYDESIKRRRIRIMTVIGDRLDNMR